MVALTGGVLIAVLALYLAHGFIPMTHVAAIRALYLAVAQPHTFVMLVGPVGAQAGEILAKARQFAAVLGFPPRGDGNNPRSLQLPNGSRLVARPAVPESLRSYSKAALIIVDEAAWGA